MSKYSTSKTPPSRKNQTGWEKVDSMRDEEIDTSDIPEITPEEFAESIARKGLKSVPRKQQVTLRIDADVLAWFRSLGPGYQTRINDLLRAYMDAQRRNKE